MRTFLLKGSILFVITYFLVATTNARIIYVSKTGSDGSNNPTVQSGAFLTLTKAINVSINGDTILVFPGDYRETLDLAGKNLVIASKYLLSSDTTDIANTKLDLRDAGTNGGIFSSIDNYNFKKIYGFTLYNSPKIAVNKIRNITIERCVLRDNGYGNSTANVLLFLLSSFYSDRQSVLKDCDIYNNRNNFLIINDDRNSFGRASDIINSKLHHNTLGENADGTAVRLGDGPINIVNTLIYKNKFGYAIDYVGNPNYSLVKVNFSTITNNIGNGVLIFPGSGTFRIVFSNSIFAFNTGRQFTVNHSGNNIYSGSAINWRNNVISGGYSGMSITNTNTAYVDLAFKNNYEGTPRFIDSTNSNYTLLPESLGSAMGNFNISTFVDTIRNDINGTQRPLIATNGPDIGAIQNLNSIFASSPPISFTATRNQLGRIRLNWASNTPSALKTYKIYRATNQGSYNLLATTSDVIYIDNNISNSNVYSYKITESIQSINNTSALDTGLTNMFRFNGNTTDYLNSQLQGVANMVTSVSDRFGNSTAAYSFNGSASYIEYNDTIANVTSSNPYTLSFWAKENVIGGQMLGKYLNMDASKSQFAIATSRLLGNGTNYYDHTVSPDNNWNHYALILESGTGKTKVLKNGILISPTGSVNYNSTATNTKFIVGKLSGSPQGPFNGIIDDIRVYKGVITESRLKNIHSYESQYGYINPAESDYSTTLSVTANINPGRIYVDKARGNSTNDGTNASPFATINQAVNAAINGDTIVVLPGIYTEQVNISNKQIVITSNFMFDQSDSSSLKNTVIDATGLSSAFTGTYNVGNISVLRKIYGFTITNAPKTAITGMNYLIIEKCRIYNCGSSSDNNGATNYLIYLGGGQQLIDCDIFNNTNPLLIWVGDRNAWAYQGISKIVNTRVHDNNSSRNGTLAADDGVCISAEGGYTVSNSIFSNNRSGSVFFWYGNTNVNSPYKFNFVSVVNNDGVGFNSATITDTYTCIVSNSIISGNRKGNFKLYNPSSYGNPIFKFFNNVIEGGLETQTIGNRYNVSTFKKNLTFRPVFKDSANGKFILSEYDISRSISEYNNNLSIDTVSADIVGVTRPYGNGNRPDPGAYQSSYSNNIISPTNLQVSTTKRSLNLNWSSSSNIPKKLYQIYRSQDNINYTLIGISRSEAYNDSSAQLGITYHYKVKEVKSLYLNTDSTSRGLKNLYLFNGTEKNIINPTDSSKLVNGIFVSDRFGITSSTIQFLGQSQSYAEYSSAIADVTSSKPHTISFWYRSPGGTPISKYIEGDPSRSQFKISVFGIKGNGTSGSISFNPSIMGQWTHCSIVFKDGSNQTKVYLDDTLHSQGTLSFNSQSVPTRFYIGSPNFDFSGEIDDVRIYDKELTASERSGVYVSEALKKDILSESDYSSSAIGKRVNSKIFVDNTNGNNSNDGSLASPYQSIQVAINNSQSGDTIILSDDTYTEQLVIPSTLGSILISSKYILDQVSSHIQNTIIDGSLTTFFQNHITSDANLILAGLTLKNSRGRILNMQNSDLNLHKVLISGLGEQNNLLEFAIRAKKVVIDSSEFFNNLYVKGMIRSNDSIIVRNSKFYNNRGGLVLNSGSGDGGILVISDCDVRNNSPVQGSFDSFGGYFVLNVRRQISFRTRYINNSYTVFGGSGAAYQKFVNNLFYKNNISVQRNIDGYNDSLIMIHNTFLENLTDFTTQSNGYWKGDFSNNIFSGQFRFDFPMPSDPFYIRLKLTSNYFRVFPIFSQVDTSGSSFNKVVQKIKYKDSINLDFTFADDEPLLGGGKTLVNPVMEDIKNLSRPSPQGTAPEVGAFESIYAAPTIATPRIDSIKTEVNKSRIYWSAADTANIKGIKLFRSPQSAPTDSVKFYPVSTSILFDSLPQPGLYFYRIKFIHINDFESDFSNEKSIRIFDKPVVLSPVNKAAVVLAPLFLWRKDVNLASYNLQVSTDSLFFNKLIDTLTVDTFYNTRSSLNYGTKYFWRVRYKDGDGYGGWSSIAKFETIFSFPELNSIKAGNKKDTLSWSYNSNLSVQKFKIYRDTVDFPVKLIDSVSSNIFTYIDSIGLRLNQRYFYRLTAVYSDGTESGYGNSLSSIPFNLRPVVNRLEQKRIENVGEFNFVNVKYSANRSYDPDGPTLKYFWFVNDSLVNNRDSVLNYPFKQGTNDLKLIIEDNDGGRDSSFTQIVLLSLSKKFRGGFQGGISAVNQNILYTADTTVDQLGAKVVRLDRLGNQIIELNVATRVSTTPSVSSDSSVFITSGSTLYGFNKNAVSLWPTIALGGNSFVTPTIDSILNQIYIGVSNKNFFSINYKTGKVFWSYINDAPINTSSVVTGDRKLVYTTSNGTLYGYDINTTDPQTSPKWVYPFGDVVSKSPAIDKSNNLYFGTDGGRILKLELNDSVGVVLKWNKSYNSAITTSPVIDADGYVYFTNQRGELFKIDPSNGELIWSRLIGGQIISTPSISEYSTIYVANDNGLVSAVTTDNKLRWKYQDSAGIYANMLYIKNILYFGNQRGAFSAIYDNPNSAAINTALSTSKNVIKTSVSEIVSSSGNGFKSKNMYYVIEDGNTNELASSTNLQLIPREPIWGTFQGNYRRSGSKPLDCPDAPDIYFPNCSNFHDSITVLTTGIFKNKYWVINDVVNKINIDTVIKVKSSEQVKLLAINKYGCNVFSNEKKYIPNSDLSKPVLTTSAKNNSFCSGDSLDLKTNVKALSYMWYNQNGLIDSSTNTKIKLKEGGRYILKITNEFGCKEVSDSLVVSLNNLPDPPKDSSMLTCTQPGKSLNLNESTAVKFNWYLKSKSSNNFELTNPLIDLSSAGEFNYRVANYNSSTGCESVKSSFNVVVKPTPAKPGVTDINLCQNAPSATLTASTQSGNKLKWYNDILTSEYLNIAPVVNTTKVADYKYFVTAIDSSGFCESSRSEINIKISPIPEKPKIIRDASGNLVSSSSIGNQWYKDGSMLANSTLQTLRPASSGNYSLRVTNESGCSSLVSEVYYYLSTGFVNSQLNGSIKVFPNPTADYLNIEKQIPSIKSMKVTLLNMSGKEVYRFVYSGNNSTIDIAKLAKGVYTIMIFSLDGRLLYSSKIMKN